MKNITYLMGAGASYFSLPLVRTMSDRLIAFKNFILYEHEKGELEHPFTEKFISELENIIEIEQERTSIDAYARQLSIGHNKQRELMRLKAVLTSFLIFEQLKKPRNIYLRSDEFELISGEGIRKELPEPLRKMIMTPVDKRYYTFWGELLDENRNALPSNVNILSWNYDLQFEASYCNTKSGSLELAQQELQIFPSSLKDIDEKKSRILKLNGTAGLIKDQNGNRNFNCLDFNDLNLKTNLNLLIDIVKNNYNRAFTNPLIHFAWEQNDISNTTRKLAKNVLNETQILVIIGYSFPRFNREIDREILKHTPVLEKIHLQVPESDYPQIEENLLGVYSRLKKHIIPQTDLSTFYIPSEY